MEVASALTGVISSFSLLPRAIFHSFLRTTRFNIRLIEKYSIPEALVLQLGNPLVLRTQQGVLHDPDLRRAMDFKKATQNESQILAVASTILAQVAITALSLENLSQAFWVARGFITFSLVASIISVYYACNQYQALSRCMNGEQVKRWIRGNGRIPRSEDVPSVAAVLTISAPSGLLSAAVHSFIIGLGVYFGYVWTRNLDPQASQSDSKAVFITYISSASVCYVVYFLSNLLVTGGFIDEEEENCKANPGPERPTPPASSGMREQTTGNSSAGDLYSAMQDASKLRHELSIMESRVVDILERQQTNRH